MTMNYTRGKEKMKKLIIYIVTCHVSESGESDGLWGYFEEFLFYNDEI